MTRADIIATTINNNTVQYNGGGTHYVVQKFGVASTFYIFFIDSAADLFYSKSTDGGFTWSNPVTVFTGSIVAFSIFYDRWSGIAADLVHMAYTESGNNDILYRSLDIATDTLGTQTTVFAGTSSAANGALTIWRSRGTTTLRVAGSIDAGAEDGAL